MEFVAHQMLNVAEWYAKTAIPGYVVIGILLAPFVLLLFSSFLVKNRKISGIFFGLLGFITAAFVGGVYLFGLIFGLLVY